MRVAVDAVLNHHRAISIAALIVLTLLAWAWLLAGACTGMAPGLSLLPTLHQTNPMSDMGMDMPMPAQWSTTQIVLVFSMWWVMMVAMMLPSAAPTILLYSRVASNSPSVTVPHTGGFLMGYLLAWGGFSLVALITQFLLERSGVVSPMSMASQSSLLSGALLIASGMYQLSPLKDTCLRHCRSPARFLSEHYRPGPTGALHMGLLHGTFCVGCCWLLMALLFVGGIMNLAWIAVLTLMVAAEKLVPFGRTIASMTGLGCLVWGASVLLR